MVNFVEGDEEDLPQAPSPLHGGYKFDKIRELFSAAFDLRAAVLGLRATGRALIVEQTVAEGSDSSTHFDSIADAYVAAAALNPTPTDPVVILVGPGTYTDAITAVSNVHLIGVTQPRATIVDAAVTWDLGTGVNTPQTALEEYLHVANIWFAQPWTITSTGKTALVAGGPIMMNLILSGLTYTGTADTNGTIRSSTLLAGDPYVIDNVGRLDMLSVTAEGALSITGDSDVHIYGGRVPNGATLADTSSMRALGAIMGAVVVGNGCSVTMPGCQLGSVTVSATGTADVRGSNYIGNPNLVGPGAINRSSWTGTTAATSVGANVITLDPPFPDGAYNVALTLVSGTGNAAATVTLKTGGDFTITDSAGGNTFDYTVIHD